MDNQLVINPEIIGSRYVLRDGGGECNYQVEIFQHLINNTGNILVQLYPRGGKTPIIDHIWRYYTQLGKSVAILCHSTLLKSQLQDNLAYSAFVDTWQSNKKGLPFYPDVIIIDEAHAACGEVYRKILNMYPKSRVLGFDGTPKRLDKQCVVKQYGGKHIDTAPFDTAIEGPDIPWLIRKGYVNDFDYYTETLIDRSQLSIEKGEYSNKSINSVVSFAVMKKTLMHHAVQNAKKVLIFCADIKHIQTAVLACEAVSAVRDVSLPESEELSIGDRDTVALQIHSQAIGNEAALHEFLVGDVKYLVTCNKVNEGINFPNVDCAITFRPTTSDNVFMQQMMRALCYLYGKTVSLIDSVGNAASLGNLLEPRDWNVYIPDRKTPAKSETSVVKPFAQLVKLDERGDSLLTKVDRVPAIILEYNTRHSVSSKPVLNRVVWFEDGTRAIRTDVRSRDKIGYISLSAKEGVVTHSKVETTYISSRYMRGLCYARECTVKEFAKISSIILASLLRGERIGGVMYTSENFGVDPEVGLCIRKSTLHPWVKAKAAMKEIIGVLPISHGLRMQYNAYHSMLLKQYDAVIGNQKVEISTGVH